MKAPNYNSIQISIWLNDFYITTLLWADSPELLINELDRDMFTKTAYNIIKEDILKFYQLTSKYWQETFSNEGEQLEYYSNMMYNFHLTRNRHGIGFKDAEFTYLTDEAREAFIIACESFTSLDMSVDYTINLN